MFLLLHLESFLLSNMNLKSLSCEWTHKILFFFEQGSDLSLCKKNQLLLDSLPPAAVCFRAWRKVSGSTEECSAWRGCSEETVDDL